MNVQPQKAAPALNTAKAREGFVDENPRPAQAERAARPHTPVPPPQPAPEPEPVLPPQPDFPVTVRLIYKPIRARGTSFTELTFREPTAADINRHGNPVHVDFNGDAKIDERKMSQIIAALTGMLPPEIEQMDPRDWNSCAYRLRGFFLPDPAAW